MKLLMKFKLGSYTSNLSSQHKNKFCNTAPHPDQFWGPPSSCPRLPGSLSAG